MALDGDSGLGHCRHLDPSEVVEGYGRADSWWCDVTHVCLFDLCSPEGAVLQGRLWSYCGVFP